MPYATKPELDATKTPTLLDIAWAAGVYEGEGTVHQRRIASAQTEVVQKKTQKFSIAYGIGLAGVLECRAVVRLLKHGVAIAGPYVGTVADYS